MKISLFLESFHGHISTQNSRFIGGRPPDKNSYHAPISRYLHIYAQIHDLMHIVDISTSAGSRKHPGECLRHSPGGEKIKGVTQSSFFPRLGECRRHSPRCLLQKGVGV
eukprot:sb/3477411/